MLNAKTLTPAVASAARTPPAQLSPARGLSTNDSCSTPASLEGVVCDFVALVVQVHHQLTICRTLNIVKHSRAVYNGRQSHRWQCVRQQMHSAGFSTPRLTVLASGGGHKPATGGRRQGASSESSRPEGMCSAPAAMRAVWLSCIHMHTLACSLTWCPRRGRSWSSTDGYW